MNKRKLKKIYIYKWNDTRREMMMMVVVMQAKKTNKQKCFPLPFVDPNDKWENNNNNNKIDFKKNIVYEKFIRIIQNFVFFLLLSSFITVRTTHNKKIYQNLSSNRHCHSDFQKNTHTHTKTRDFNLILGKKKSILSIYIFICLINEWF